MRASTRDEFIQKAKTIHGNQYRYDNVRYTNNHTPVEIICPTHGVFWQKPHIHTGKKACGCPDCSATTSFGVTRRLGDKYTTEQFITMAKQVHGDAYDYSKTEYRGMDSRIVIICHVHGEFEQYPRNHMDGNRCRKCAMQGARGKAKATNALRHSPTSKLDDLKNRFEQQGLLEHHKRGTL